MYIYYLFKDSIYKANTLEEILKDCFRYYLRIFDYPNIGISRYKVVVTITTIAIILTRLFTNYNSYFRRKLEYSKIILLGFR